jgi:hypothetical protein
MTARSTLSLISLGFLLTVTASCGKKGSERADTVSSSGSVATTPSLRVADVALGKGIGADKHVSDATDTFKPNDTIYASIWTDGAAPAAALAVRWTFEDGQVVNESKQNLAPTGPAVTEFHIAKPDGWPPGKYQVAVVADDQPAGTRQFTVVE